MPARQEPKDCRALASDRGLVWLGADAPGTQRVTTWRRHDHVFGRTGTRVPAILGCPVCSGKQAETTDDDRASARSRRLSRSAPRSRGPRPQQTNRGCPLGSLWHQYNNTLQPGSGCPPAPGQPFEPAIAIGARPTNADETIAGL